MGMGGGPSGADGFTHQWQYKSTIDPEELFRKIFGDAGFKSDAFSDFAESQFGFGAAQEVYFSYIFLDFWFLSKILPVLWHKNIIFTILQVSLFWVTIKFIISFLTYLIWET